MIALGIWELVGVIFLIIGILGLYDIKKKKIKCTSKTYGKVIDIIERIRTNASNYNITIFYPVFEYNVGEHKVVKESLNGSSDSKYIIGQEVEVYYNPEDYNEYYIAGDTISKTLSIIFTIIGIVAIILGIYLFIKIY